jgi:hypothetical protein
VLLQAFCFVQRKKQMIEEAFFVPPFLPSQIKTKISQSLIACVFLSRYRRLDVL